MLVISAVEDRNPWPGFLGVFQASERLCLRKGRWYLKNNIRGFLGFYIPVHMHTCRHTNTCEHTHTHTLYIHMVSELALRFLIH